MTASGATSNPAVSVVIPAYKAVPFLEKTLQSVMSQAWTDWECCVVDDGSPDHTAEIARGCAAVDSRIAVVSVPNGGVARARNTGLARAKGEFVIFLDADDLWIPETLSRLVKALQSDPQAPASHGIAAYIDGAGNPLWPGEGERWSRDRLRFFAGEGVGESGMDGPTTFEHFATQCPILSAGAVLIRRAALEKVGAWDVRFSTAADWELWVRLSRLGGFAFCNEVVLLYRKQAGSMSFNRKEMRRESAEVRRLIANSPANSQPQRDFALRAYKGFYQRLARIRFESAMKNLRSGTPVAAAKEFGAGVVNKLMALRGQP